MLKTIGKIKNLMSLTALSFVIAYFLADKIIEKGLIETSFNIALLFLFLFSFFVISILVVALSQNGKNKEPIDGIQQNVGVAGNVKQTVRIRNSKNGIPIVNQKAGISAGDVEQDIDSD